MTTEEQAIEHAYQAQIEKLFAVMCTKLGSGDDEDECRKSFTNGIAIALRAKQLAKKGCALDAVSSL